MQRTELTVINEVGLHARPAALFVKEASRHRSRVAVRNRTTASDWADAKSILGVLALGVEKDHVIELEIEGEDEAAALQSLSALVESDFVVQA